MLGGHSDMMIDIITSDIDAMCRFAMEEVTDPPCQENLLKAEQLGYILCWITNTGIICMSRAVMVSGLSIQIRENSFYCEKPFAPIPNGICILQYG